MPTRPYNPDTDFVPKAVVHEGIRRLAHLGVTKAFVGSAQPFYKAIGFQSVCEIYPWIRYF